MPKLPVHDEPPGHFPCGDGTRSRTDGLEIMLRNAFHRFRRGENDRSHAVASCDVFGAAFREEWFQFADVVGELDGVEIIRIFQNDEFGAVRLRNGRPHLREGEFGHDWGAAACGDSLYINEYRISDLNLLFCDLALVDTSDLTKQTLFRNTILRGRCASGELVCVSDYMPPSSYPDANPLCSLYGFSSAELCDGQEILFIDPETAEVVRTLPFDGAEEGFEDRYFSKTLEEIQK